MEESLSNESFNYQTNNISDILGDLISRTNEEDTERIQELQEINQISGKNEKGKALLNYLYSLNKQNDASIYRLCDQLNGHVEFLQRLIADQRTQSLFLISQQSGRTFLKEATRDFMAEQSAKSTELICALINEPKTPLYSIDNILNGDFNPEERTKVLKKLAGDEKVSNEELSITLVQEALIVQCLLTYIQSLKKNQNYKQPTDEIRESIRAELEAEYQAKYAQLDANFKARKTSMQPQKTQQEIRDEIEEELRIEYDLKFSEMKAKLTEKLKKEFTPVKQEVNPIETLDSIDQRLRQQLVREAENKIRNQVIDDLTADIKDSLEARLRPVLKKELKDELEPKLTAKIIAEQTPKLKVQIRKQLEVELEPIIEDKLIDRVRQEETEKIRAEVREELRIQLRKEIEEELSSKLRRSIERELKNKYRKEIEQELRRKLLKELVPQIREEEANKMQLELEERIENEIKPSIRSEIQSELETTLPIRIRREEREKLKEEIRESVIDDVRDEVEREMIARQQLSVPKWMEDAMREDIRRELEQRYNEILRKKEAELRERVFNDIQQETIGEMSAIYENASANTSYVSTKQINDYKELKEMFREELEAEIRAKINRENRKKMLTLTAEQENRIRADLRNEVYQEIKDSVIDSIRSQVEEEMRKKFERELNRQKENENEIRQQIRAELYNEMSTQLAKKKQKPVDITKLKLQLRAEVERELSDEIEQRLRAEIEEEYRSPAKSYKITRRIRETVIEEIREEIINPEKSPNRNKDIKELTSEIVEFIRPEVEKSLRTSFLELEHVDITPTRGVSESTIRSLKAQIKNELKEKYIGILRQQVTEEFMSSNVERLFKLVCKALGIVDPAFTLDKFFKYTEQNAVECINIRKRYDIKTGPISAFVNDLYQHIQHIDDYKTHTRGLLTRQARAISDAQSENCANTWATWAKSLYKAMTGKEFTSDNSVKLRLAIDDVQAVLTAQHSMTGSPLSRSRDGSSLSPRRTSRQRYQ